MALSAKADPLPSQECEPELSSRPECPICYHGLPLKKIEHVYHACCGQVICNGCMVGKQRTQLKESQLKELGIIVEDTTPEEEQFRLIKEYGSQIYVCPYCRASAPDSDEEQVYNKEILQRLYDRIEIRDDRDYTIALNQLGSYYKNGERGLPQNLKKAEELYKKAYDLDYPSAAWNLYCLYTNHYSDQKETEMEYLQRGEMLGDLQCTQVLIDHAYDSGNMENFARLCAKSVRLGGEDDIDDLWLCYRHNLLSKDVVATTLRANQALKDEVTTKRRDFAKRYEQFCDDGDSDDDDSDGDGDDNDNDDNDNDSDDDVMHRNNNGWE